MDVEIREAEPEELAAVRGLIEEYVQALGIDLGFQEIDAELRDLAATYAPPEGRILVAVAGAELAGCVALRPGVAVAYTEPRLVSFATSVARERRSSPASTR